IALADPVENLPGSGRPVEAILAGLELRRRLHQTLGPKLPCIADHTGLRQSSPHFDRSGATFEADECIALKSSIGLKKGDAETGEDRQDQRTRYRESSLQSRASESR